MSVMGGREGWGGKRRDQICFRKMTQVFVGRGVTSEGKLDQGDGEWPP